MNPAKASVSLLLGSWVFSIQAVSKKILQLKKNSDFHNTFASRSSFE